MHESPSLLILVKSRALPEPQEDLHELVHKPLPREVLLEPQEDLHKLPKHLDRSWHVKITIGQL
jgi:hypothetical protein